MRHYFKVNTGGEVTGPVTTTGGFTDELDLTDALNQHPHVLSFRNFAEAEDSFDRFLQWECPCPSEVGDCHCPHINFLDYYANGDALVEKASLVVVIDDVAQGELDPQTPIDRAPGATVEVKLQADVPDGTTVVVTPGGKASILQAATELTFTDGETEVLVLKAPAQGTAGRICGRGKLVRQFGVELRGWA